MYELLLVITILTNPFGNNPPAVSVSQQHIPGAVSLETCNTNASAWQDRVRQIKHSDMYVFTTWSCIKK